EWMREQGRWGALGGQGGAPAARRVGVLFFDKPQAANWAVPWHQDRTIAVTRRVDLVGFGPWSVKDGVSHVEPPVAHLQHMLTLRVFVDDCGEDNGPLEIVRGSHRLGRLAAGDLNDVARQGEVSIALGRAGDVLIMKTLAAHRSKRASVPVHRRVLHVDYATAGLPAPLQWMLNLESAAARAFDNHGVTAQPPRL